MSDSSLECALAQTAIPVGIAGQLDEGPIFIGGFGGGMLSCEQHSSFELSPTLPCSPDVSLSWIEGPNQKDTAIVSLVDCFKYRPGIDDWVAP